MVLFIHNRDGTFGKAWISQLEIQEVKGVVDIKVLEEMINVAANTK